MEKALIVQSAPSGISIATRNAVEQDSNSNEREIQRFDFSSGKLTTPMGSPIRTDVEDNDSNIVSSFPAGLTGNLITVGDKSLLVVMVEFESNTVASLDITPIIYDNEASPGVMGILQPKTVSFTLGGSIVRAGTANYMSPVLSWDLVGAYKIGLHVSNYSDTGNSHPINVWGYVI